MRLALDDESRLTFMVNCSPVSGGNGRKVGVPVNLDDVTRLEAQELELPQSKRSAEEANYLRLIRCDEYQGYHSSRPLPPGELARLYREHAAR